MRILRDKRSDNETRELSQVHSDKAWRVASSDGPDGVS